MCTLSRLSPVQLWATLWTVACQGSSVPGILQARILKWAIRPSSRGSSQPRDQAGNCYSSRTPGRFFTPELLIIPRATTKTRTQRGILKRELLESKRNKFAYFPLLSNCVLQSSNYNLNAHYFLSGQTSSSASPIHLIFTSLNKYLK